MFFRAEKFIGTLCGASCFKARAAWALSSAPLLWIKNIIEVFAMPTSIIGLFEDQDTGRRVVSALAEIGCKEDAIETLSKTGVDETAKRLVEAGYENDK